MNHNRRLMHITPMCSNACSVLMSSMSFQWSQQPLTSLFRFLATASSDKTVKIWSLEKNISLLRTLMGHQRWVWDCAFSADSAYLVTGTLSLLIPMDLSAANCWELILCICAASSDKTAKLWDLKTGEVILEYSGHHSKALTCVALNDSSE